MNLTTLKAQAEAAKTDSVGPELWQMEVSPEDVLRLVEVARAAIGAYALLDLVEPNHARTEELFKALEGIES